MDSEPAGSHDTPQPIGLQECGTTRDQRKSSRKNSSCVALLLVLFLVIDSRCPVTEAGCAQRELQVRPSRFQLSYALNQRF